ncbi:MAG: hypothetical protein RLZZ519_2081, partial [Bacteroidota bacterium]
MLGLLIGLLAPMDAFSQADSLAAPAKGLRIHKTQGQIFVDGKIEESDWKYAE